ncbi:hypothetical protein DSO57_1003634 [Entomophthora muscae]|uniref:Uncharacterized protein n=1 Tax=Entomophthora muscae TaxID=34485 RepID=A0ACC2SLA3_9FUNG|nr:hypothetical protein DSO57_1003634 [Entomophthora muscae]
MAQQFGRHHDAFQWVRASNGSIPPNAVQGGMEDDGRPLFIARQSHEGSVIPGKAASHIGGIMVSYGGQEVHYKDYEVLVGDARLLQWKEVYGRLTIQGWVPFACGHEANGLELYICKTRIGSGEVIGKVSTEMATGMVYGYDTKETSVKESDVYYVLSIPQGV